MTTVAFFAIALVTLGSAAWALSLRNLIRSVLLFVINWAGVAAFYLWAGAEFLAFAQVLVYVGAISMVVLFAVLLTRTRTNINLVVEPAARARAAAALTVAACVAAVLVPAILTTKFYPTTAAPAPSFTVRELGLELMEQNGAALVVAGVILTVALLGAVVLASSGPAAGSEDAS